MPSRRIAADLNAGTYYLTLTIQRWYYLFDRHNRWQILAESLRYCQENQGSRYFCESLFWASQPKQAAKITRPLLPAAPQPSCGLRLNPTRG